MKRKNSAQHLLTSFKSTNNPSTSSIPPPLNLATTSSSNSTSLSFASVATPTVSTPLPRDWDAQSLHSETVGSALTGAQSPPLGQGTSVEYLRELVQKRITTLTYIRSIHEGRSHWFHTILISRSELDKVFNNNAMKKRTARFAILGLSLSTLLDINQPQDLLRGLLNTITEYDQAKDDGDKQSKMRRRFLPKAGRKVSEYTGSYADSPIDASYLIAPSTPFPLDYHQTLLSLLDVLSEVYNKIGKLLGPSPFPHSNQHMMGPLGLLSPHPGVSYLFAGEHAQSQPTSYFPSNPYQQSNPNLHQPGHGIHNGHHNGSGPLSAPPLESELSSSLWAIANPSAALMGSATFGGTLGSPPPAVWNKALGEMVQKIDEKLKRITSTLLKDLDAFARNGIRDELASLDPLLRNASEGSNFTTGGKVLYDFEA
ncbi:hypothetical protein CVT24_011435 [Panaeolus cyanescens]|uniref:Uncharacterized protein n=1 Tax=Panaeolus cyanescens TaxID=181874 RepID=A0A409VGB5_9AGAR|nr:hypothetical protein CVT24_011435 [Panaeolus cyanescens]